MDEQNMFTPYDEMTQTRELQMLKTLVPFLPVSKQKQIIYLINFLQFQQSVSMMSNPPAALSATEVGNPSENYTAMLNALRKFCSPKEQETIDNMLNLLCIMDNYGQLEST